MHTHKSIYLDSNMYTYDVHNTYYIYKVKIRWKCLPLDHHSYPIYNPNVKILHYQKVVLDLSALDYRYVGNIGVRVPIRMVE